MNPRSLTLILVAITSAIPGGAQEVPAAGVKVETLPPEVVQLYQRYETSRNRVEAPLGELKVSYLRKLDGLRAARQAQGDLNGVVAIQAEVKNFEKGEPGQGSSFAPLAEVQAVYHDHEAKIEAKINPERLRLEEAYIRELEATIAELTRQGKIEAAVASRERLTSADTRLGEWRRIAEEWDRGNLATSSFSWTTLRKLIQENKLARTAPIGGSPGDLDLEIPVEGALLVGFDLYMAEFGDSDKTVRKIVPLYRTESGKVVEGRPRAADKADRKRREIAKPGYVIAGITTHSEAGIRKMKVRYEALRGMGTNPEVQYESEWYGEWDGGRIAVLTTDSRIPVGLEGAIGLGVGETRLIVLDTK